MEERFIKNISDSFPQSDPSVWFFVVFISSKNEKSSHGSKVQYYICTLNRAVGTQTQTYGLRVRERQ